MKLAIRPIRKCGECPWFDRERRKFDRDSRLWFHPCLMSWCASVTSEGKPCGRYARQFAAFWKAVYVCLLLMSFGTVTALLLCLFAG